MTTITAAGLGGRMEDRAPGAGGSRLRRWSAALRALAAPHPAVWGATLVLVVVDAAWLWAARITLEPAGFLLAAGLVAVLLGGALIWARVWPEPTLRGMTLASAALVGFTTAAAVLHYLAATLAMPLADGPLMRAEATLGFDWPAAIAFLADHPDLAWWLALAYHSSGPQVALTVIVLAATRRVGRLWAYVRLFCAVLLIAILTSALMPALGPYASYAPQRVPSGWMETAGALWHLEPLEALRAGRLHRLALGDIRALVTFPSFHVALAILTAWALAPVRFVGLPALALNAVVAAAVMGAGGHYLPDVLAGAALGFGALGVNAAMGPEVRHARCRSTRS